MHLDPIIRKRLQELSEKTSEIAKAKSSEHLRNSGRTIWHAPRAQVLAWGTSVISLFRQVFGDSGIHTQNFQAKFNQFTGYYSDFESLVALLGAAREDYEGGYIFSIQGLVRAEVLSDALEQAEELLKSGYKDPACVLVGVSLESAVKYLAVKNSVQIGKLDRMNNDLAKVGAYNVAKQKQLTAWADLRNKAAHGDWNAYSNADVAAMHTGVQQFVADFL